MTPGSIRLPAMTSFAQRAEFALRILRERGLAGSELQQRLADRLITRHYEARRRLEWDLAAEQPHFYDHRLSALRLATGTTGEISGLPWARAFYAADAMKPTDQVLDIGCGDGFFTRYFYASCADNVDAIDVEPTAIQHAKRHSAAPNIAYTRADATTDPFPAPAYDVIVFDGAIGHFPPDTTNRLLRRIASALNPGGIFVGSESLGRDGTDHLQFFDTIAELRALLVTAFPHVQTRVMAHAAPAGQRNEAYWRCANDVDGRARGAWA